MILLITAGTVILQRSGKSACTISKLPCGAQNLVSWFSGKSLKLLPPDVRFQG